MFPFPDPQFCGTKTSYSGSRSKPGSGSRPFSAQFTSQIFALNLVVLMLEAALLLRKLSSHFLNSSFLTVVLQLSAGSGSKKRQKAKWSRFLRFRFLFQNTGDSDKDSPKSRGQDPDPMKLASNWPRHHHFFHSVGTAASYLGWMQIHDEVFQYKKKQLIRCESMWIHSKKKKNKVNKL